MENKTIDVHKTPYIVRVVVLDNHRQTRRNCNVTQVTLPRKHITLKFVQLHLSTYRR